MVNALVPGSSGLGSVLSPGRGHCVVFLGKTLNSYSASLQVYKWVLANCRENLTICGGVTCDGLASRPEVVEILLPASGYRSPGYAPAALSQSAQSNASLIKYCSRRIQLERFPKYIGTTSRYSVTPITENTSMIITSNNTMLAMSVKKKKHCYTFRLQHVFRLVESMLRVMGQNS